MAPPIINSSNQTCTNGTHNSSNVQLLILSHDDESHLPPTSKSPIEDNIKNSNTDDIAHEYGKNISKSKTVHVTTGETSADITKSRGETQRSVKKFFATDSHIPTRIPAAKAKKPVRFNIPEDIEEAVHKYRMDFIKHIADSPLYANSSIKRPWEVVSRISEELIEDALTTVAEELEMESLLKQMIDVELKDYSEK